ncbi:hypothetical protein D4R71_00365 [bacterium]|nr:MAG: hypothetical protein D4R71_00365 [bacterium]
MKIKLRHKDFCDSCDHLTEQITLGGHKRCTIYGKILLPSEETHLMSKGQGYIKRLDICKEENEVEVYK